MKKYFFVSLPLTRFTFYHIAPFEGTCYFININLNAPYCYG